MNNHIYKTHKIRLNPTPEQEAYFRKACGTARFVYNWALAEWKRHKNEHPGQEYGLMAIKKDFNALKADQFPWVYEVAKDVAEGAFTNLATAFQNYYDSKAGKRPGKKIGFPKFKSKKYQHQSFRLNNDRIGFAEHALRIPKLGWVNMAESLRLEGKVMGAIVSRQANRWYVSVVVEMDRPEPIAFPRFCVGIDLGIKTLATLSDGTQYENQAILRANLTHLKRLNRCLSRRQVGSQRWRKAKNRMARFHKRIANRRADYLHKMTTEITNTYQFIGIEDLNVKGLLKNHRLALSLADASFGEIRRHLRYKSDWLGGRLVIIDRFFPSSRLCSCCGAINDELELGEREWTCMICGSSHDRDRNAAANIELAALQMLNQTPVVATSG